MGHPRPCACARELPRFSLSSRRLASLHDGRGPEPILGLERTQAIDGGGAWAGSIDDGVTLQNRGDQSPDEGDDEPSQDGAEPGQLRRGDAIGRFVTLDLLGVGGMGEVYLCYDPELDRRVAVKLLHPPRSGRAARPSPAWR